MATSQDIEPEPKQQSSLAADIMDEPLRKRLRRSADLVSTDGNDTCASTNGKGNLDDSMSGLGPPAKDDTLGSLLSPTEAYSRKRRTPGRDQAIEQQQQQHLAPGPSSESGAGGMARLRRQSRTPEGRDGGRDGVKDGRAERRFAKAQELAATEANYVRILQVIVNVIRSEVAELLPPKTTDLIFTGLAPIYELHCDIEAELRAAIANWDGASTTIGSVFASRADRLSQLYPPFVNFFNQAKEELARWEKRCPRFRAYLRQCRARPECLRQSLGDLMIRPVQRLPSVTLILADLLKYTGEDSPDYACLQRALSSVRRVLEHINEEKRTTDLRVALFDVMNEVENFPPYLLSAHRSIVDRFDVVEVGSAGTGICRPGAALTLFLLTDYLLVTKRRQSISSSASNASGGGGGGGGGSGTSGHHRSPRPGHGSISIRTPSATKPLRYLELLPLNSVRAVHDIRSLAADPDDRRRIFAIECRLADADNEEPAGDEADPPCQFCFALAEPLVLSAATSAGANEDSNLNIEATAEAGSGVRDKASILRGVCEQIGRLTCCANPLDLLLTHSDPAGFPLDLVGLFDRQNLLSAKARRFGRRVVTRVLSNRTPRRTLSRALLAAAAAAAAGNSSSQQQQQQPQLGKTADSTNAALESPTTTVHSVAGKESADHAATHSSNSYGESDVHMPDSAGTPHMTTAPLAENNQQQQIQQQLFKKPDKRPKSRPSSSLMSSVCRLGWVSLRHSVAGGKKSTSSAAAAAAAVASSSSATSTVSSGRLTRKQQLASSGSLSKALKKLSNLQGTAMDCSSSSLASLAGLASGTSKEPHDDDPTEAYVDIDDDDDYDHDEFHRQREQQYDAISVSGASAIGVGHRSSRLYDQMSMARASTATLANVEQLRSGSLRDCSSGAAGVLPAAAVHASSSRFSIGGAGSGGVASGGNVGVGGGPSSSSLASSSAKRFRKHFSSWSLFNKGK